MTLSFGAGSEEMTCGECGRNFQQDFTSSHCISEDLDLCGLDCAFHHQERTGHHLTHMEA